MFKTLLKNSTLFIMLRHQNYKGYFLSVTDHEIGLVDSKFSVYTDPVCLSTNINLEIHTDRLTHSLTVINYKA